MKELSKNFSENAVIIIGNGFDLAHNMPTSYRDFSRYLLNEKILTPLFQGKPSIEFFLQSFIDLHEGLRYSYHTMSAPRKDSSRYFVIKFYTKYDNRPELDLDDFQKDFKMDEVPFLNMLSNKFLGKLFSGNYTNWFDIEQNYFVELQEILETYDGVDSEDDIKESLEKLNEDLKELKTLLAEYLNRFSASHKDEVQMFFEENFDDKDIFRVINFNYTNTFDKLYKSKIKPRSLKVRSSYIHGKLNEKIIFGFGDDGNDSYRMMKDTGINEFLRCFKTFHYAQDSIYRLVLEEVKSYDDYEVYILGHSLGRTDKTFLAELLNSKKCLNIHLFKREDRLNDSEKEEDLWELHCNLSRILEKDTDFRNKIIPIKNSSHFPYVTGDNEIIASKNLEIYGVDDQLAQVAGIHRRTV